MGIKKVIAKPFKIYVYERQRLLIEQTVYELPLVIGRHSQADISLRDYRWLSRQHAIIHEEAGRVIIHDLKSRKGMDYQGRFVAAAEIEDGTRISIGSLDFVFEFEDGEGKTCLTEVKEEQDLEEVIQETAKTVVAIPNLDEQPGAKQTKGPQHKNKDIEDGDFDAHTVVDKDSLGSRENEAKKPVKLKIPKLVSPKEDEPERTPVPTLMPVLSKTPPPDEWSSGDELDLKLDLNSDVNSDQDIGGLDKGEGFSSEHHEEFTQVAASPIHQTGKLETNSVIMSPPSKPVDPSLEITSIVKNGLALYASPFDFAAKGKSKSGKTSLESYVTWKGEIYDIHGFLTGEKVIVGPKESAPLTVPTLKKKQVFASVTSKGVECRFLKGVDFKIKKGTEFIDTENISEHSSFKRSGRTDVWVLGEDELLTYELGNDVQLHLRKVPASKGLAIKGLVTPDQALKEAVRTSAVVHAVILALAFLFAPKVEKVPKLENVPKRYAKLLVQPTPTPTPPPTPTPTPPPTPPPTPVAKKTPPKPMPPKKKIVRKKKRIKKVVKKKVIRRPKQVVVKRNKNMKKVNQFPLKLNSRKVTNNRPMKKPPKKPTVDIQSVGALAALGAISPSKVPQVNVQNVKINPNAGGGQASPNAVSTNQLIGALKAKGGKLAVGGGSRRIATKGKGYGTGAGYGVQGSRSLAGTRGVAGSVGVPKLYKVEDSEGLTQKQVMAVVKKYIGKIQQCYERSLLSNPDISGRVEYEWEIDPAGNVTSARVKKSEARGAGSLNTCVVGVFKSMKFPRATNGQSTSPNIGFPFGRL